MQKILISTGIYPPKIGGPAQYAKNLKEELEKAGHSVILRTFNIEDLLPSGLRHIFYFIKILPAVLWAKRIIILDTFSVGLPTVLACLIFRKKCVIRTGGDFLWEQYTERTGKKILLRNFYKTEMMNLSRKEKVIFSITKWILRNVTHIIFSTEFQRKIFIPAYSLSEKNTSIIENYYGPKESDEAPLKKEFIGSSRNLVWKNLDELRSIFVQITNDNSEVTLFMDNLPYPQFIERMKKCWAVILISLGDISSNMILDSIRLGRPFICTQEVGLYERIKDAGIFVDPLDRQQITEAVLNIITPQGYTDAKAKVDKFNFIHTWKEISSEFLNVLRSL